MKKHIPAAGISCIDRMSKDVDNDSGWQTLSLWWCWWLRCNVTILFSWRFRPKWHTTESKYNDLSRKEMSKCYFKVLTCCVRGYSQGLLIFFFQITINLNVIISAFVIFINIILSPDSWRCYLQMVNNSTKRQRLGFYLMVYSGQYHIWWQLGQEALTMKKTVSWQLS